jgi:hypothetical protein
VRLEEPLIGANSIPSNAAMISQPASNFSSALHPSSASSLQIRSQKLGGEVRKFESPKKSVELGMTPFLADAMPAGIFGRTTPVYSARRSRRRRRKALDPAPAANLW